MAALFRKVASRVSFFISCFLLVFAVVLFLQYLTDESTVGNTSDTTNGTHAPTVFTQADPGIHAPLYTDRYTNFLPLVNSNVPAATVYGIEMNYIATRTGLNQVAQAKTTWVRRAAVWWPDVEPTEGERNWSALSGMDEELRLVEANAMKTVLVIRGTPTWAQKVAGSYCGPITSTKMTAFANFVYDLVLHYSSPRYNVQYYEFVNEPDVDPSLVPSVNYYGCWGDKNDPYYGGGYYATMLQAVYPRVKQANPTAQVLVGGLMLTVPSKFFEGILLKYPGDQPFDGVALHSYDYYSRTTDGLMIYSNSNWGASANTSGPTLISKTNFINSRLAKYNVSGKFLIVTEVALLCNRPITGCSGNTTFESAKAIYIAQIYPASMALGLKGTVWYSVMGWPEQYTQLLYSDLTPTPAYTAYAVSRSILGGAVYSGLITAADIGSTSGVTGYKFLANGKKIWTVWSMDGTTKTLTLATTPAAVTDTLGASIAITVPGEVTLLPTPTRLFVYIQLDP